MYLNEVLYIQSINRLLQLSEQLYVETTAVSTSSTGNIKSCYKNNFIFKHSLTSRYLMRAASELMECDWSISAGGRL